MSDSLGREIDLLAKYPKPKRDISKRGRAKTIQQQKLARKFVNIYSNFCFYYLTEVKEVLKK